MNRMQAETKKDSSTSCINNYSIRTVKINDKGKKHYRFSFILQD